MLISFDFFKVYGLTIFIVCISLNDTKSWRHKRVSRKGRYEHFKANNTGIRDIIAEQMLLYK